MNNQDVIWGQRVAMVPPTPDDAELLRRWYSEPICRGPYLDTEESTTEEIVEIIQRRTAPNSRSRLWLITLQEGGHRIGYFTVEYTHFWRTLGFVIAEPEWRGAGFGGDALRTMLDYLFADPGIERIEMETRPDNVPALAVMLKMGCRMEGILRKRRIEFGQWQDYLMLSCLREDWTQLKQRA